MSLVPQSREGALSFFESHVPDWVVHAAQIVDDPALAADIDDKTSAARSAVNTAKALAAQAKAATVTANEAIAAMRESGSTFINAVRLKAQVSGDMAIYEIANLPRPKERAPVPAPGTPYAPRVSLNGGGSLKLTWKCQNPPDGPGVRYEIYRKDGTNPPVHVASAGERSFVDSTIPAGTSHVIYTITAVRSTKQGVAGNFLVQFGTTDGDSVGAQVRTVPAVRKAA